jgi:signal transduction histidine kinase
VVATGIDAAQMPDTEFVYEIYRKAQTPPAAKWLPEKAQSHGMSGAFLGVAMRAKGQIYGVISILVSPGVEISQDDLALLTSIADQIGIAVENARLYRQSQHLAVAEERRRLARDLHDSVTQSLYSLTLFAEAGHRLLRSGEIERVDKYLERLNQTAQDALKEMRLLLYELRPWALESGKLVETIQHRLDAVERRSGLTAHLITTPLPALPPRFEDNLYHITLEALNNALKHAFASAVTVQLCADESTIQLRVSDNGGGFDTEATLKTGGMGLTNMRERAEELGGTFTIESDGRSGTTVCACLPFNTR